MHSIIPQYTYKVNLYVRIFRFNDNNFDLHTSIVRFGLKLKCSMHRTIHGLDQHRSAFQGGIGFRIVFLR